jgi:hypothetical protein
MLSTAILGRAATKDFFGGWAKPCIQDGYAGQVNRILDLKDKESKVTDEDRKKVSDEMKKQKIDLFTTKLITMVDHFSETLSQEEINKVLRKLIK